jgi:hypothetical protein
MLHIMYVYVIIKKPSLVSTAAYVIQTTLLINFSIVCVEILLHSSCTVLIEYSYHIGHSSLAFVLNSVRTNSIGF